VGKIPSELKLKNNSHGDSWGDNNTTSAATHTTPNSPEPSLKESKDFLKILSQSNDKFRLYQANT